MSVVTLDFEVEGIKCGHCCMTIEQELKKHPMFITASCCPVTKKLNIIIDSNTSAPEAKDLVTSVLSSLGFTCTNKQKENNSKLGLLKGIVGLLASFVLLALPLVGIQLSFFLTVTLAIGSSLLTLALGKEFYKSAFLGLKHRAFDMNTLFTISTISAIVVTCIGIFVPWLPMMFEAPLMIFGFRHIGIYIESLIKQSLLDGLTYKDYLPKVVSVIENGVKKSKEFSKLEIGEIIEVKAGEMIPVDGINLSGDILIYDTIDSGARIPKNFKNKDFIHSGMLLAKDSAPIQIQITKSIEDSYLANFDKQIKGDKQSLNIHSTAKTMLKIFIPAVVLLALSSFVIVGIFFPVSQAIQCAVCVLVSACPCTLGMILPLTAKIGMSKAKANGVDFKNITALEEVAHKVHNIEAFVFDLHGTLTEGNPTVTRISKADSQILNIIYHLEKDSPHPVACALKKYVLNIITPNPLKFDNIYNSACGIKASSGNETFYIGSKRFLTDNNIEVQDYKTNNFNESVVYFVKTNDQSKIERLVTIFVLDPLRAYSINLIDYLKQKNKEVYLCTGADQETANAYAATLKIKRENIFANQRASLSNPNINPKLNKIKELQREGKKVAMIGDGPNDAPVIAGSDLGIVLKTSDDLGHLVTQEQAHFIIENKDLRNLLVGFEVAKETVTNMKQNLGMSIVYNLATLAVSSGLMLAAGIMISPGLGVFLMVLESSLVLANAYRFKKMEVKALGMFGPITLREELYNEPRAQENPEEVKNFSSFLRSPTKSQTSSIPHENLHQHAQPHL